ncbi:MAG: hypothetical protein WD076_03340 [Parvularculaceae bacterium]
MARSRPPRRTAPVAPKRRVTLSVTDIGARGDGVAMLDGAPVFVPLTAPGDVAIADVRGERGALVELIEKSPHRAAPPCKHYGQCGGCALQHVSLEFYRGWKRARVVETLARSGLGDAPVSDLIKTPAASRCRATFAVTRSKAGAVLGFNARQSSEIVAIDDCQILHPDLLRALPALRELAGEINAPSFDLSVTLCRNGLDVDIIGKAVAEPRGSALQSLMRAMSAARAVRLSLNGETLVAIEAPVVDVDGIAVTPPPGGFLQASREGEAALLALVKVGVGPARKIADLFSGCGAFALPLAKTATVFAADVDARAVTALTEAAAAAQRMGLNVNPLRAEPRDLFERPLRAGELREFDAVVFDPPRAGARAQAEELAKSKVPVVVAVSCDPSTFARDAAILSRGGYRLFKVTPVDQFVYSPHVELVGVFERG